MYYSTLYQSPVGALTLASTGDELVGLWVVNQKYHGGTIGNDLVPDDKLEVFKATRAWLDRYFDGQKPAPVELPLAPIGSGFRQGVWDILCKIPYGQVTTYGAIAKEMAADMGKVRMSSQAVGGAVGHNPISIIIPCHRVVGSNGSLTGYAGGIMVKQWLLKHEGVDTSGLFIPTRGTAL